MNKYKILLGLSAFLNAPNTQENIIFGNESDYNQRATNALYSYRDFYETEVQKLLKSEDIKVDYFESTIREAKNDIIEALPGFDLNHNNIDFYVVIKQNVQNKKVSIYITFFSYCSPLFTQYLSFINHVSQSTQNLIGTALYKINA